MNWNDNAFSPSVFREDVVATLYSGKSPTLALDGTRQFFSRYLLQIASSMI
jgi:hypothetical protein